MEFLLNPGPAKMGLTLVQCWVNLTTWDLL